MKKKEKQEELVRDAFLTREYWERSRLKHISIIDCLAIGEGSLSELQDRYYMFGSHYNTLFNQYVLMDAIKDGVVTRLYKNEKQA